MAATLVPDYATGGFKDLVAESLRVHGNGPVWDETAGADGEGGFVGTPGGGGGGSDATYTHVQDAAATVWTIDHPLSKRPSVTVTDSAGTVVQGRVEYPSATRVIVRFSVAFSGRADLN